MCYQTRLIKKREELAERFNAAIDSLLNYDTFESCKGFDFSETPIILDKEPKKIQLAHWGLVPSWSESIDIQQYTLNARIETLSEKASFKDNTENRCLIIADGFYEWQWLTKNGSNKDKYLITKPDESLFTFAGIYDEWVTNSGQPYRSYAIVTTQANDLMSKIHNIKQRMPIILKSEDEQAWLAGQDYTQYAHPYEIELNAKNLSANSNQLDLF